MCDILNEFGFIGYSLQNLWVKYINKEPVLFITFLKNDKLIIKNQKGEIILTSNNIDEVKNTLIIEIREIKLGLI
jgi:hypothetical protein